MYICICMCVYICVCVYMYICICMCVCIYIYIYERENEREVTRLVWVSWLESTAQREPFEQRSEKKSSQVVSHKSIWKNNVSEYGDKLLYMS